MVFARRPVTLFERHAQPFGVLLETRVAIDPTAMTEAVDAALAEHGAVLLRGLPVAGAAGFAAQEGAITPDLHAGYPELPRHEGDAHCHRATAYPEELAIDFHNEADHRRRWPRRQWFFAETVAAEGGRTLLADGRRVTAELAPGLKDELERRGVCYEREQDGTFEDGGAVGARVRLPRPFFVAHPESGERLPFHQLFVHHASRLPPLLRAAVAEPPRDATWGDGEAMSADVVEEIHRAYVAVATPVGWAPGDVLVIDNVRTAHAREPFRGARSVLVALAGMHGWA